MIYASYSQYAVKDVERELATADSPLSSFPIETARERMPDREFKNKTIYSQSYPIWTISGTKKKYKVSKPIKARIYSEGELFFAENETLVIIGSGETIDEAIDDFGRHILHFYQYYKKLSWDKVTGDAIRLKNIYETLFIEQE